MEDQTAVHDLESVTCPNCGASLSYKPGTTKLTCEHCGSSFDITVKGTSAEAQKENDLIAALSASGRQTQSQALVVKCPACGAESTFDKNLFSTECPFCGSPLTVQPDQKSITNPQAVLPFRMERNAAVDNFKKWLRRLWFAPNNLKKTATSDRFTGIYLPYWTFDADTQSIYRGERGDHYTETVRRVVNGREETQTVTRTRWSPASGSVQRAFDDVLITASRALPDKYLNSLEPWDIDNLTNYDNRFLSGFKAEVSQVDIKEGFDSAKNVMAGVIQGDIRRDIGGDEQRILSVSTQYSKTTYKYILLPVWLSVYRYANKIYRFAVNARTGEVLGERPYSAIKIILAVLAALIVIGLIIHFTGQ